MGQIETFAGSFPYGTALAPVQFNGSNQG